VQEGSYINESGVIQIDHSFMKNQDLLIEENKSTNKNILRKLKTLIFTSSAVFFLILTGLHLFGNWSIARDDITHYNGDPDSKDMKFLFAETKFTFNNQCLLFRQSHCAVDFFDGDIKNNAAKPQYWQLLNSFNFVFDDHLIVILSFFILAISIYYLLKRVYRQKAPN
jgi:hypothetical protein